MTGSGGASRGGQGGPSRQRRVGVLLLVIGALAVASGLTLDGFGRALAVVIGIAVLVFGGMLVSTGGRR